MIFRFLVSCLSEHSTQVAFIKICLASDCSIYTKFVLSRAPGLPSINFLSSSIFSVFSPSDKSLSLDESCTCTSGIFMDFYLSLSNSSRIPSNGILQTEVGKLDRISELKGGRGKVPQLSPWRF